MKSFRGICPPENHKKNRPAEKTRRNWADPSSILAFPHASFFSLALLGRALAHPPSTPANSLTPSIALSTDCVRPPGCCSFPRRRFFFLFLFFFFFFFFLLPRPPALRLSGPLRLHLFHCPSNLSPPHKTRFSTALTGWHTGSPLLFPYFASLAAFSNAGVALSYPACCCLFLSAFCFRSLSVSPSLLTPCILHLHNRTFLS